MSRKKSKESFDISRRELLQNSAVGAFGLGNMGILAEAILHGAFNTAHAQSLGITNKNYVYISQYSAPPRWYFDLPLTPDGQKGKFQKCTHVGTRYGGSTRYTEVIHETSLVNGLHMPWMWRFDIPRAGGGVVPLRNLMEGMLIMRGTNTNNPAHEAAQALHYRPNGIPVSLTALTAELSKDTPIAGIDMGCKDYIFKSSKGLSGTQLRNDNNMIKQLLDPFLERGSSGFKSNQAKVAAALESGLGSLDKLANSQHPKTEIVKKNMESAVELFSKNFGNLDTVYSNLHNKYLNLISNAINPNKTLVGINDKPIGTTGTRDKKYRYGNDDIVGNPDLRDMMTDRMSMGNTARRFAVAEFILTNKLTSSVSFNIDGLRGFGTKKLDNSNGRTTQFYDEHNAGCMPSLLVNTFYNLAVSACLYEFISVLKANNMYQDTVIDFCGEFGRNPQNDGGGCDHSAQANVNTIFSGAIGGNGHVIGNIEANKGGRNGTWGYGGFNPGVGTLNLGHFTSTLSSVMGIPSPVTAVPSLLKLVNGKLVPTLPTGTIVD